MSPARDRFVLHVVPVDLARGAQALARVICDELDGNPDRHEALTLFEGGPGLLHPEHRLDAPSGRLRALGLSPVAAWRFRRFVRSNRPDVVVSHGGEVLKYLPFGVPRRIPTVYYQVGTVNQHLAARWQRAIYRYLVPRRSLVVAVSEDTANEAAEVFAIQRERITVIYNARDPEEFQRRPAGAAPADTAEPGEVTVLFLGTVSEAKGADRFVQTIGRLRAEGVAVRGVLAGEGPLLESLRTDAELSGVELHGHESDVPALMSRCDVFAFPGVDREGMPGVLIEAGMCELPTVAADLPGVRTVLEHGTTGWVIEPGDDEALADRLRSLIADPSGRAQMGAAARARCIELFSNSQIAPRWNEALRPFLPALPGSEDATGD